jgi:hypothetical protein
MISLIEAVQKALTPELLKKTYVEGNKNNPTFGHCYVATEALYYLLGDESFKPCRARDVEGIVHWWLQNDKGTILDPTAEQYTIRGLKPPYEKGRRGGFLTKRISKRAKIVIDRIKR